MSLPPFVRHSFRTSDEATAREFLDKAFGGRMAAGSGREPGLRVDLTSVIADDFSATDMKLPGEVAFTVTGRDQLVVNTVLSGGVSHERGKTFDEFGPGQVMAGNYPTARVAARIHDVQLHTVVLSVPLLRSVGGLDADEPWRVLANSSTPTAANRWQSVTRFVNQTLVDPGAVTSPLIVPSLGRLLAATALATFPNSAVVDPTGENSRDAHPDSVRRAIAFIESDPQAPMAIGDIAHAAYVTPRTIQLAFRRHLETTPMAYLRRVRLDHARHDLLHATSDASMTVTEIAARWGFTSSKFTELYRAAYGEPPSHTLKTRPVL